MSSAHVLDDTIPHGTAEGFKLGCRSNGGCPAGAEHGLSCKRAKTFAAGDYRYQRLARSGATPAEIAFSLGLIPDTSAPAPALAPERPTPVTEPTAPEPDPQPAPTAEPLPKWSIRHAWVAFSPDGEMHGPFTDHPAALEHVRQRLTVTVPAPKRRRKMTESDLDEIRRLNAAGHSDAEIARRIGRAQSLVSSWRRRMGLEPVAAFGGRQS